MISLFCVASFLLSIQFEITWAIAILLDYAYKFSCRVYGYTAKTALKYEPWNCIHNLTCRPGDSLGNKHRIWKLLCWYASYPTSEGVVDRFHLIEFEILKYRQISRHIVRLRSSIIGRSCSIGNDKSRNPKFANMHGADAKTFNWKYDNTTIVRVGHGNILCLMNRRRTYLSIKMMNRSQS